MAGKAKRVMALLRRANEQTANDFVPIPEGVWRFQIDPAPELKYSEKFGNYGARFPLLLVPSEQQRVRDEYEAPPAGFQQGFRSSYTTGLSLGFMQRNGQYKSTKLVDFTAAVLGQANIKRYMEWIRAGGGPMKAADPDDQQAELDMITHWLEWFGGMECYGSIRHEADSERSDVWWARFGGPMAVGSLPGQREDEYQALGRGKLRSMIAEFERSIGHPEPAAPAPVAAAAPKARTYEETFPEDNEKDIPF